MLIVIGAAILDCLWLVPFHPEAGRDVLVLNLSLALLAMTGNIAIATRARRRPEPIVFVVLVAVDLATIALGMVHPALELVAAGYLLLLPPIVALAIPWATRTHVGWLGLHGLLVLAYALTAPAASIADVSRDGVVALLLVATTVSLLGHVANLRARVLSFVHIGRIQALNREARRDRARLDRLNRILEEAARNDALTGLNNRLSLKLDMAAVRSRIERYGESYGLLMLDLDRFKTINDSLGHVAGDDVLRTIAATLVKAVRPNDGIYRYGGEEFAALIQVTRPAEALVTAERIRRAVADLRLPHPGNHPHRRVTISVGVAVVGPEDLAASDESWFARADGALYDAKAAGRNRSELESSSARPHSDPSLSVAS